MSCPPGASRGCERAVVHVFARTHAFTYLEVKSASSGGGDNTLKGRDTLLEIISEHATSTALPALLRKPPPPNPLDSDLDRNASWHVWPAPSPLLSPPSPSDWFISALSLSSHPSTLSISSCSSPGLARINISVRRLSAHATHLLLCVSRLLCIDLLCSEAGRVWCVDNCLVGHAPNFFVLS